MKFGYGLAPAHHGEILQGAFRDADGGTRQGLVSVPCGIFWSEASFLPDSSGEVTADPPGKWKARRAAEIALGRLGVKNEGDRLGGRFGGRLIIRSQIPERLGLGSSTSDVAAAVRAVADALGARFSPDETAAIAVEAELASDPVFFGERFVHFAQREGRVIGDLPYPVPGFEIIGFDADPSGGGVDTLNLKRPCYTSSELDEIKYLLDRLRRGLRARDIQIVGEVSTESAKLNQRRLRLRGFDLLVEMAPRIGAVGLQIAHSGSVAGFLFPPGGTGNPKVWARLEALQEELGVSGFWRFRVGGQKRLGGRLGGASRRNSSARLVPLRQFIPPWGQSAALSMI
jgi:uncharacterized protein involved in propanediol utilization